MHKHSQLRFIVPAVAAILLVVGGIAYQRSETRVLRLELQDAKRVEAEILQLRKENERLKSRQIPAAELEQLRSDHAALPRLRAELSDLRKRASAVAP
jgi:hypothetical protein